MSEQKTIRDYTPTIPTGMGYAFDNTVKIDEVMGKTIILHRFFVKDREYHGEQYKQLTMEFTYPDDEDTRIVTQTSSEVLIDQLNAERESGLPLRMKIEARGKYYTLVAP